MPVSSSLPQPTASPAATGVPALGSDETHRRPFGNAERWPDELEGPLAQVERAMQKAMAGSVQQSVLPPMARSCLQSGGKRMRARLALEACRALGVEVQAGCAWAAACELLHNATLVHDDLQDGDTSRRGQPTLWVVHGAAQAINVGDWLFMLAFSALSELPTPLAAQHGFALTQAMAVGMAAVIEGQGLECASASFFGRVATFPYEAMVRGKTAALFALPVLGAAILAGRSNPEAHELAAPFGELGVLFQMQDDVVDLWGDKGREVRGADLYEGKLSALVVAHLRRRPEDGAWLEPLLQRPRAETRAEDVLRAIACFEQQGSRQDVLEEMERRSQGAEAQIDVALRDVMQSLLQRTWAPIAALRTQAEHNAEAQAPTPAAGRAQDGKG